MEEEREGEVRERGGVEREESEGEGGRQIYGEG